MVHLTLCIVLTLFRLAFVHSVNFWLQAGSLVSFVNAHQTVAESLHRSRQPIFHTHHSRLRKLLLWHAAYSSGWSAAAVVLELRIHSCHRVLVRSLTQSIQSTLIHPCVPPSSTHSTFIHSSGRPSIHPFIYSNAQLLDVQAKLLEAVASQRETARQLQEAGQAFDSERARLEQQVRSSREEGSVRIHTLEDTIRKLGNRSDLHQVQGLPAVPDHTCTGHAALHQTS